MGGGRRAEHAVVSLPADLDKFAAEDIMDPIAKAKMVALKGIKKVMAQGSIGVAPGMNR